MGPSKSRQRAVTDFRQRYAQTFATLGRPLTARNDLPAERVEAMERKLGIRLPKALREYYLVAGRVRRFHLIYYHLYAPRQWFIDSGKLVFMEENQAVVLWGVDASRCPQDDPPVFLGVNGEKIEWHPEHEHCSVFLQVMLHWQGAFAGAMPYVDGPEVSPELVRVLDRDWSFVGEVNRMRAYNKPGRAACFVRWDDSWRLFIGGRTMRDLEAIAKELNLTLSSRSLRTSSISCR